MAILIPCSTTTSRIDLANVTEIERDNVLLGGDISILKIKDKGCPRFYAYYLTHYKKYKIASYAQGSTIMHLYFAHLKNMEIDYPLIEEQQKIADLLTALNTKLKLEETKLKQVNNFKKALMQQVFV